MLLCLDLKSRDSLYPESSDIMLWGEDREEEMREALQASADIWVLSRDTSSEAFKASEALTVMLSTLGINNGTAVTATEPDKLTVTS